jgi:hypothetical protein
VRLPPCGRPLTRTFWNLCLIAADGFPRARRGAGVVLDWNVRSIDFYESIGARVLPEWKLMRMDGANLAAFAAGRAAARSRPGST